MVTFDTRFLRYQCISSDCGFLFCRGSFVFIRYQLTNHCKIFRICLPLPLQYGSFFWALLIEILLFFLLWIFFSSKNILAKGIQFWLSLRHLRSFRNWRSDLNTFLSYPEQSRRLVLMFYHLSGFSAALDFSRQRFYFSNMIADPGWLMDCNIDWWFNFFDCRMTMLKKQLPTACSL